MNLIQVDLILKSLPSRLFLQSKTGPNLSLIYIYLKIFAFLCVFVEFIAKLRLFCYPHNGAQLEGFEEGCCCHKQHLSLQGGIMIGVGRLWNIQHCGKGDCWG